MGDKFSELKSGDTLLSADGDRGTEPIIECIECVSYFAVFKWLDGYGVGAFVLYKEEFNESHWEAVGDETI